MMQVDPILLAATYVSAGLLGWFAKDHLHNREARTGTFCPVCMARTDDSGFARRDDRGQAHLDPRLFGIGVLLLALAGLLTIVIVGGML